MTLVPGYGETPVPDDELDALLPEVRSLLSAGVHAEGVRIHPFVDGNGRSTRLHADLVYLAAQDTEMPELFDWHLDKHADVDLLRAHDGHRDPRELASHLGTRTVTN